MGPGSLIALAAVILAAVGMIGGLAGFLIAGKDNSVGKVHARIDALITKMTNRFVTRDELNGKLEAIRDDVREVRKRVDRLIERAGEGD